MALRVVRLGTPRLADEGLRIGVVRYPPRGVPKDEIASRDYYDAWLPELSPSHDLIQQAHHAQTEDDWHAFHAAYRRDMDTPTARHLIAFLAELSHRMNLSVGCYDEIEAHCHRMTLRELLVDAGADLALPTHGEPRVRSRTPE